MQGCIRCHGPLDGAGRCPLCEENVFDWSRPHGWKFNDLESKFQKEYKASFVEDKPMNILNKTYCYLAGNLENTEDAEGWRTFFFDRLSAMGVNCLDPTRKMFKNQVAETEEDRNNLKRWRVDGDFVRIKDFMREIIRRDLRAIDISTFVIFKLEPTKPSWGTVHELVLSSQQRKPILVVIEDKKQMPLWLIGLINMDFVFETKEDLLGFLEGVNSGEKKTDPKYWKFLEIT